jgi:hypothetical protein
MERNSNSINNSNLTVEEINPRSRIVPSMSNKRKKSINFKFRHRRKLQKLSAQDSYHNNIINFKRILGVHITQNNNDSNFKTAVPLLKFTEINFKNSGLGQKGKDFKFKYFISKFLKTKITEITKKKL